MEVIERTLIQRCKDRDDQAFDELVEKTKAEVYAYAYRWVRDQELAFDLVQDAYIKLYKFLPNWNFSCQVQTWMYRVITNACIDVRRKSQKYNHTSISEIENTDEFEHKYIHSQPDPRKQLQRDECLNLIERCIGSLPKRMQEAFRMKYIGGLSLKEISEVQGCSIGTIKATLHQAIKKMRLKLGTLERGPI